MPTNTNFISDFAKDEFANSKMDFLAGTSLPVNDSKDKTQTPKNLQALVDIQIRRERALKGLIEFLKFIIPLFLMVISTLIGLFLWNYVIPLNRLDESVKNLKENIEKVDTKNNENANKISELEKGFIIKNVESKK